MNIKIGDDVTLSTGTRSTCATCGEEIYYSQVRLKEDPWVHSDWTKHYSDEVEAVRMAVMKKLPPYDHRAVPKRQLLEIKLIVESPMEHNETIRFLRHAVSLRGAQ